MFKSKPTYRCRQCGAASYQRVMARALDGSMRPTAAFKCSGCRNVFDDLRAWRDSTVDTLHAVAADARAAQPEPRMWRR